MQSVDFCDPLLSDKLTVTLDKRILSPLHVCFPAAYENLNTYLNILFTNFRWLKFANDFAIS